MAKEASRAERGHAIALATQPHLIDIARMGSQGRERWPTRWNRAHEEVLRLNHPLIATVVRPYLPDDPHEREALFHVARIGLWRAIDPYLKQYPPPRLPPPEPEPESPKDARDRPNRYSTFATNQARWRVLAYMREMWDAHIPRGLRDRAVEARRVIDRLTQELQRSPTFTEVADVMNVSQQDLAEALGALRSRYVDSLNSENFMELDVELAAQRPATDDMVERLTTQKMLEAVRETFGERDWMILTLRLDGHTFPAIVRALAEAGHVVGESRVRLTFARAVEKIAAIYPEYRAPERPLRPPSEPVTPIGGRRELSRREHARWREKRFGPKPGDHGGPVRGG